jgi:hypothetical protein
MASTFEVSDVEVGRKQIETTGARKAFAKRTGAGTEASAANHARLAGGSIHPFVDAAQIAFDEHLPLVLSPDDVWLCIAQAFAHHVDENAEALRGRFVRHEGKAEIIVIRDGFRKGDPDNDWPGVFGEFSDAIAEHVGKQRDLVVADFSTTGPVERAASEVSQTARSGSRSTNSSRDPAVTRSRAASTRCSRSSASTTPTSSCRIHTPPAGAAAADPDRPSFRRASRSRRSSGSTSAPHSRWNSWRGSPA